MPNSQRARRWRESGIPTSPALPTPDATMAAGRSRWTVLAVLFLARTAMGFQFQSVASAVLPLAEELRITYAEAGTLIGVYMLPGVLLSLPGGLLGQRFGDKAVCAAGLGLMLLGGLAMGASSDYALILAGRLVSGLGGILFNLVLTKMATDWFAGREIVFAMAVILASWPFGIAVGLVAQPPLLAALGWRSVMLATALLCGLAWLLLVLVYRLPPAATDGRDRLAPMSGSPAQGQLVLPPGRDVALVTVAAVMWGGFNMALQLFFSFTPSLLSERGRPLDRAAAWTSLGLWIGMVSLPACGYVVQRIGRPRAAIMVFSALSGVALAGLALGDAAPLLACCVLGIAIGPPAGAIFALPARVLLPAHRAAGLGLFYTAYYAVVATGPSLAGLLRDAYGTTTAPLLLGAGMFVLVLPLLLFFEALFRTWARNPTVPTS